jgi:hypothetical protein
VIIGLAMFVLGSGSSPLPSVASRALTSGSAFHNAGDTLQCRVFAD